MKRIKLPKEMETKESPKLYKKSSKEINNKKPGE